MVIRFAVHAATLCAVLAGSAARGPTLEPVDEAAADPTLFALRAELIEAAVNRDVAAVTAVLADDVLSSFGGNGGVEEFVEFYELSDPDSPFWGEFAWALANGGAFLDEDREYFEAPYWSAAWPTELDPFEFILVRGTEVPAYSPDEPDSAPLALLTHEVVRWIDDIPGGHWTKISVDDGREFAVASEWLSSPIGFRAGFEKRDGAWWLTVFVEGD